MPATPDFPGLPDPRDPSSNPSFDPTLNLGDNEDTSTDNWVPEDALESLVEERTRFPDESNKAITRRILDENAPLVVHSIIRLSLYSKSERTRLDAGKYVLDRVLGKPGEDITPDDSPLNKFIEEITNFVADHAEG